MKKGIGIVLGVMFVLGLMFMAGINSVNASGLEVAKTIPLTPISSTGEPARMVTGDLNGDGKVDYVFTDGTRLARAYDHDGALLWTYLRSNGDHCANMFEQPSSVVWDMDGDGKDEVMCTLKTPGASTYDLLMLDGQTGTVKNSVTIPYVRKGGHLAIAYMTDKTTNPYVILKVDKDNTDRWPAWTGGEAVGSAWAYDKDLNSKWKTNVPAGGHFYWPYDINGDGKHELLAGKHIINAAGTIIQTLDLGSDHVDSLMVADIHPDYPGLEIATVGSSGIRLFRTDTYARIWLKTIRNIDPQWLMGGEFDPSSPGLELEVKPRQTSSDTRVRVLDKDGNVIGILETKNGGWFVMDYDGDRSQDEILVDFGEVRDDNGNTIEDTSWLPSDTYARWSLARDVIGDEREELITWSHDTLIIGSNSDPFVAGSIPSFRDNQEYRLRAVNHSFRGTVFFDFRTEPIPEPGTMLLLGTGVLGVMGYIRRRRMK